MEPQTPAAQGGAMMLRRPFAAAHETEPTRTTVRPPRTDDEVREFLRLLPRYRVLLHNDEYNTFEHVIATLVACVPTLDYAEAERITWQAHTTGCAQVIICLKELAEHYRAQLQRRSLTSSIEPA